MVKINPQENRLTLINTFTVKPENQEALINLLKSATDEVFKKIDGFISASIHRGVEGTKVVNYVQWQSKEHLMAIFKNPEVQKYQKQTEPLIEKVEPVTYFVVAAQEK